MISFQKRLLLLLTTLFVVSFLLLGFFLSVTLSDRIFDSKKHELKNQAKHIIHMLNDEKNIQYYLRSEDTAVDQIMIKKRGKVIYKSDSLDVIKLKERLKTWKDYSVETEFFRDYNDDNQALLIQDEDGYSVYLIDDMSELKSIITQMWEYLLLIFFIVLPVIYIIVRYVNKSYIAPISEVTYASKLLAAGNYKVRVPESSVTETKDLYISTNILARTLQSLNNEQKLQRNRLETTLQNIPSALLLVNNHGDVVISNDTYNRLFNNDGPSLAGYYEKAIAYPAINQMIKEAIATEKTINETLEITINVHQKYFDAAVVPVLSKTRRKLEGVVIVLHDITQLKTLEQMRKDFVANVSHELKTPITSIKGFSETLLDGAKNDPESLDMFLNIILKESNRIQVLVSELLELSKIERNNHLQLTPVNLSDKVMNCVEVVQSLAAKKNLIIKLELEEEVVVQAEPSKLKQVIINLLSNAINYSTDNDEIIVRVMQQDGLSILEIKDNGIGIAEEEQIRIFERFYRVDKARSRDSGGTGLGLAIVKHIVEVFNGEIEVDSQPGAGSTFRVKFKAL
ncbi:two-component system histidine kinase PnpS [Macrococcus equipercicus]|uniref:histidine kinase n=1 Tax=Macrococcus equipercicus TaxID=69967 RepID=A0A9Q9BU97_9STAP|nr:ATP-binding protein [Macrococcus equipercicus]UTH13142.1 PAS domain-containing protein [Macrococcus equipercicus]